MEYDLTHLHSPVMVGSMHSLVILSKASRIAFLASRQKRGGGLPREPPFARAVALRFDPPSKQFHVKPSKDLCLMEGGGKDGYNMMLVMWDNLEFFHKIPLKKIVLINF